VAIVMFLGIAERSSPPILLAFVTRAVGETERVAVAGALRAIRNAGYTVGALAASLALISPGRTSLAVVVLGNCASFVLAALLLRTMPLRGEAGPIRRSRERDGDSVLRRPAFLSATALSGILSIHRQILAVGLPLWIVTRSLAPSSTVSILVAINTILVVVLQVRLVRNTDEAAGAARVLHRSGWALLALTVVLALSTVRLPGRPWSMIALLLAGTVALTFAEMWQAAGAWGLSLTLSPERARSRYLSVFNLGPSAQDVCGALLLTALVLPAGPAGWLVLGGILAAAGLLAPPVARWAERERLRTEQPAATVAAARVGIQVAGKPLEYQGIHRVQAAMARRHAQVRTSAVATRVEYRGLHRVHGRPTSGRHTSAALSRPPPAPVPARPGQTAGSPAFPPAPDRTAPAPAVAEPRHSRGGYILIR
jgi:hypothetical protein